MKKHTEKSCCCDAEDHAGGFPGEPDETFYNRRGIEKETENSSCLCMAEKEHHCPFRNAVLAGETPEMCEKSISAGMLQRHLPPKGKAGKLIVHAGKLFLIREDSRKKEEVVSGSPAWIHPGEYHHLEVAGPVKFHVEFYTVPEAKDDSPAALRPGEAFIGEPAGKH